MGRGKITTLQAAIFTSVVALGATGAFAQNSAVNANLTLTTSLSADTNPGLVGAPAGTVFDLSENLSFSLSSETSTQLLEISGGAGLSFSQTVGGGSVTDFTTPNVTLHYFREAAASDLDATANYWSGEVISSFDIDPSAATFLIVDIGTLAISGASVAYNWGLNAPLGFSVNASHDMRDYAGTTNPALIDTTTNVLSASANLRISAVTQGSISATRTDFASADEALSPSTETNQYRFGITHELARALMFDGNVGFRE